MKTPEFIRNNPITDLAREQARKHPYCTTAVLAGVVFSGTMYDAQAHVEPILQQARQEADTICNSPSLEELDFVSSITSNANPLDRQRANQIEARVHGCYATASLLENRALKANGRAWYHIELLASGISGAVMLGAGILGTLSLRKNTIS